MFPQHIIDRSVAVLQKLITLLEAENALTIRFSEMNNVVFYAELCIKSSVPHHDGGAELNSVIAEITIFRNANDFREQVMIVKNGQMMNIPLTAVEQASSLEDLGHAGAVLFAAFVEVQSIS